ncbi:uncharacterized protein LOC144705446 [Wolffia australiana]
MKVTVLGFETVRDGYDSWPDFSSIIAKVRRGPSHEYWDYVITDGYLFYKNRLCVPRTSLRNFLTWECHAGGLSGHFGRDKTIAAVEYQFYWPSLKRYVGNIVADCCACALVKQKDESVLVLFHIVDHVAHSEEVFLPLWDNSSYWVDRNSHHGIAGCNTLLVVAISFVGSLNSVACNDVVGRYARHKDPVSLVFEQRRLGLEQDCSA